MVEEVKIYLKTVNAIHQVISSVKDGTIDLKILTFKPFNYFKGGK